MSDTGVTIQQHAWDWLMARAKYRQGADELQKLLDDATQPSWGRRLHAIRVLCGNYALLYRAHQHQLDELLAATARMAANGCIYQPVSDLVTDENTGDWLGPDGSRIVV